MSQDLFHHILSILMQALVILALEIAFIIVGSRYGWFLWMIRKFNSLRNKSLAKRVPEGGKPQPGE